MMKNIPVLLLIIAWSLSQVAFATLPEKPNVVFIVMDDFDILDMTKYKDHFKQPYTLTNEIETPELDDFYDNSLVFNNFHTNGANCAPTRGSLLTGLFPSDLGFYRATPLYSERGIFEEATVIANVLNQNDYVTANIGKWNVGHKGESNFLNPEVFTPTAKGFDYSLCTVGCFIDQTLSPNQPVTTAPTFNEWGYHEYSRFEDKRELVDNTVSVVDFSTIGFVPTSEAGIASAIFDEDQYMTKKLTDDAIDFMGNQVGNTEPFFLNLWYWLPHGPNHVPLGIKDSNGNLKSKYQNYKMRSDSGDNYNPPFYMGTNSLDEPVINSKPASLCTTNTSDIEVLSCNSSLGEYAAMVTRLDEAIGRVIDQAMQIPNTLIIIVSDNGGANGQHVLRERNDHGYGNDPSLVFKGSKNEMYERGTIAPMMIRWSGSTPNSDILTPAVINDLVLSRETYSTLAKLSGIQLSNPQKYGADFTHILKNNHSGSVQENPNYVNNFRSEWLTSAHRPIFYENNVDNHPHGTYVDVSTITQCKDKDGNFHPLDQRGEYQHFATQQNLWKHVYHSNSWESYNNFIACKAAKSELFTVAGTGVPGTSPPSTAYTQFELNDESSNQPHVVDYLELLRKRWQQGIGMIDFNYEQISSNATEDIDGNIEIIGTNGFVSLGESERYNSSDGNFTFASVITPSDCSNLTGTIAERENSWLLTSNNGQLKLKVYASELGEELATTDTYSLDSGANLIACQVKNHVAFTIFGGRKGGPLVRLFLNGDRVDTKVSIDNQVILPASDPFNQWSLTTLKNSLVLNSGAEITLGNALNGTSLVGAYERPKMYVTSFSNEDMGYQGADRLNRSIYENTVINYSETLINGANKSNPIYQLPPVAQLPSQGDNSVAILTAKPGQQFGASANQEFSFSTVINLDGDQPYNQTVIAKQTADPTTGNTQASWILKLKEYVYQGGPQYQLKLNIIGDDGSNALCASKTLSADQSHYIHLDGESVQVGFNVNHGKIKLFMNNQIIDTEVFTDGTNTCSVAAGNQVFLGNKYANCQGIGTPVSKYCQKFDGTIGQVEIYPTPQYTTQLNNKVSSKADILSFSSSTTPSNYPYVTLTGNFDEKNSYYHFATTANLIADSIDTHATIARQTYDNNGVDTASWVLKYKHDDSSTPAYPANKFKVKLNLWFASGSISLDPDEIINPYEEHHIAFSLLGDHAVLYIDGVEVKSVACPGLTCEDFLGGDKITFGAQKATACDIASTSCKPFPGYLYNPRIWHSNQTDEAFMQWDARYNYKF